MTLVAKRNNRSHHHQGRTKPLAADAFCVALIMILYLLLFLVLLVLLVVVIIGFVHGRPNIFIDRRRLPSNNHPTSNSKSAQ
jgi:uncharacterized membrane protein